MSVDLNMLEGLGLASTNSSKADKGKRDELGQEDFFKLMITQLQNQDPFEPMESGDFLGQIAQFGTVNGIGELQKSFESIA
ncbi:MAG: flagellar hook assembly protein FlgD, partial [Chromatiaceae bacterium]